MSFFKPKDFQRCIDIYGDLGSVDWEVVAEDANLKRDAEIERLKRELVKAQHDADAMKGLHEENECLRASLSLEKYAHSEYVKGAEFEFKRLQADNGRLRKALEFIITGPARDDDTSEAHRSNRFRLRAAVRRAKAAILTKDGQ